MNVVSCLTLPQERGKCCSTLQQVSVPNEAAIEKLTDLNGEALMSLLIVLASFASRRSAYDIEIRQFYLSFLQKFPFKVRHSVDFSL